MRYAVGITRGPVAQVTAGTVALAAALLVLGMQTPSATQPEPSRTPLATAPLAFTANAGQANPWCATRCAVQAQTFYFTRDKVVLDFRRGRTASRSS